MRRAALASSALLALVAAFAARAGGIPSTGALIYAGQLQWGNGPAEGPHDITVSLWNNAVQPDAGQVCSTAAQGLDVDGGAFSIVLSDTCTQAVSQNPNLWFQVTVDGTSFDREAVGAMPFAVEAAHAPLASSAYAIGSAAANVTTQSDGLDSGSILFATTPADLDAGSLVNYFEVTDFGMGVVDPSGQNVGFLNCATQGTCTASSGRGAGVEFGAPGSGEGIASRRTPGFSNSQGLDFYTAYLSRMTLQNDGGIVIPGAFSPAALTASAITITSSSGFYDLGLTWLTFTPNTAAYTATCPPGQLALTGGAYIDGNAAVPVYLVESRPNPPDGWVLTCYSGFGRGAYAPCTVAWVLCMDSTHAR